MDMFDGNIAHGPGTGRFPQHPNSRLMVPHFQGAARQILHTGGQGVGHFGNGNAVGGHAVGVQFHPDLVFPLSHDIDL